ncbi:sporulation integral membrane protein YtvI [Selenihalanaerobacter shriftii]|uniref:Sporulation integral membrane protein YtvI n=1 Tax=Selenihalanaerobacter shriftii TaxID=142842 RepID=A0A1T4MDM5_9FIRM|nr:sporulation integral membrane protein YtvI [Selenihalanaerobacter shriftii]SJZ64957.1 sporulation integral membrane protein YtvI [Selenihalanaerobacter shriftii]
MKPVYKLGLVILGVVLLSVIFFKYILVYLLPFVIAFIITSLIEPIIKLLQTKFKLSRGIAVAICLGIILIIIILVTTIFFSRLFIELNRLANNIPEFKVLGEKMDWVVEQNQNLSKILTELKLPPTVKDVITHNLQELYQQLREVIRIGVTSFLNLLKGLPRLITVLLISLISTFFISRDRELINEAFLKVIPNAWQQKTRKLEAEIMDAAVGFIRAELILISITTILSISGLLILGSDYAITLGLLAGILDLIPVIGPSLVFGPLVIYSLIIGQSSFGIALLVLYTLIAIVRQLTEAKIIGKNIGLHPLATLISMYVGVQLLGISGFFIGPAVLIVVKAIARAGFISILIE